MNRMEIIGMEIIWKQMCRLLLRQPCIYTGFFGCISGCTIPDFKNPGVLLRTGF